MGVKMNLVPVVLVLSAGAVFAGEPPCEQPPALRARAKITCEQARDAARKVVPDAVAKSAELEEEGGHLVYSFDLQVAGKTGIEEVQVNAVTGRIVSHRHETPAQERKEH